MIEEIEIWKDIPEYEGLYQVSSLGNVKSLLSSKEKLLKQSISSKYLVVNLSKYSNQKTFKVHQLVAMAFHGHVPCGYEIVVDHKDNNPLNNRADNLQIIPQRENASKDKKGGTSEFTGVCYKKTRGKWEAAIYYKNRNISLGYFDLEIDAKNAYQKALKELNDGLDLNILYPKYKNKSSKYKGVCWCKTKNKWKARYKKVSLGYFLTELEAHEAVQSYIAKLESIS